jgi:hypothetical protein
MRPGSLALHVGDAALVAALPGAFVTAFEPNRAAHKPTLDDFGTLNTKVTTRVPAAQRPFRQGLLQSYALNDLDAARAFKAALTHDRDCAMCAWGVADRLGPNINTGERADLAEAQRGRPRATPRAPGERALINAMAERCGDADAEASKKTPRPPPAPICDRDANANARPLDAVSTERMRKIALAHPDDPDVTTLQAEALMIATLLHMPAHTYVRLGQYGDAVRVNNEALAAEVVQTRKLEAQDFSPRANWDGHNLHFL